MCLLCTSAARMGCRPIHRQEWLLRVLHWALCTNAHLIRVLAAASTSMSDSLQHGQQLSIRIRKGMTERDEFLPVRHGPLAQAMLLLDTLMLEPFSEYR